ncbi:hypothetical protein H8356DRAFT_1031408 [Neocallimastix lanati (nom. inval.)]|jgi:hypothetical protein|uniref:SMAD/FHA domain-containing protein n=1 Tax=Neocallimastix californiae TaxID=1754190 RepID=A0A1Y2C882_9FUNG|nr:hypothetical protein H8356DRAFT_1031408 [Neocallimastix sp. JGI-2020a]ORY43241.1 hypothetical protein LY90DRAFT_458193 [Neocallimastix californiae]|eukprot:ORY43241.1 hypothetical protein LY90DRAFT_458193 [Neocallimastix californiae]
MSKELVASTENNLSTNAKESETVPVVSVRLVSYNDPSRSTTSLPFEPIERNLVEGVVAKIGRQVNRPTNNAAQASKESIWFQSKVVSRSHAEIWAKDCQVYLRDVGSSSGTFLNRMRLSPSNKESRPYPLKDGDIIQLGIDYQGKTQDIFKCVIIKIQITNRTYIQQQKRKANPARFMSALRALLSATNPYSTSFPGINEPINNNSIDCCICLCHIGPFQALFIAPCSHCFHYKCINPILSSGDMFLCPVCRQVANLKASVSSDSLFGDDDDELESEDNLHPVDSPSMLSSTPVNTISNIPHPHTHSTLVSNSLPSHHINSTNITSDVVSSPPDMSSPINELSNANQPLPMIPMNSLINVQNASTPIAELQNMNINEGSTNSSNENITENQPFHATENMNVSNAENNESANESRHYSPMPPENMVIDSNSNNADNNSNNS